MKDKLKNKKLLALLIVAILIIVIGLTYAYFQGQLGIGANANVTVTTKTTDSLTFNKGSNITITPTQANYYENAGNLNGSTTLTATLRANNDTNSATDTYNVYLNITGNSLEYTTQGETAELIMTVTNPTNNPVTTITGLTYTTVGGVSGFDITEKKGLIKIADDYTITSSGTQTDTWNITITYVNLNSDQQKNANKKFTAQAIIQKEDITTALMDTGPNVNGKITALSNSSNATAIKRATELPNGFSANTNNTISITGSENPIYVWISGTTIYFYSIADLIYLNANSQSMFNNLYSLNDIADLAYFNTSLATNMSYMFEECGLTTLTGLNDWDVSSVTNMSSMFLMCEDLANITALANWDVSLVTNMDSMFRNCQSITTLSSLSNWNVSSVTNMEMMFYNCSITTLSPLANWDVSLVTNMKLMFYRCSSLTSASAINDWDIFSVNFTNNNSTNNGFWQMFTNANNVHPDFSMRSGTWSDGTFIPSS